MSTYHRICIMLYNAILFQIFQLKDKIEISFGITDIFLVILGKLKTSAQGSENLPRVTLSCKELGCELRQSDRTQVLKPCIIYQQYNET